MIRGSGAARGGPGPGGSSAPMPLHPLRDALLVVDLQRDFLPGGALGVAGGAQVVAPIAALAPRFGVVVATQDWHPPGHVSFASSHPGAAPFTTLQRPQGPQELWPDHCVRASPGAALDPRWREAVAHLEARLVDGQVVPERVNRGLAGLTFCQKGSPSRLATLRFREIDRAFRDSGTGRPDSVG